MPKMKRRGATGSQADDDDDDDDENTEQPMSRDDTVRLVNSAVAAQLNRKLGAAVETAVAPLTAQLTELGGHIATLTGAATAGKGKGGKAGKGKRRSDDDDEDDDEPSGRESAEVAEMKKRLADMDAQLKKRDADAAAAERQRREDAVGATVREALAKLKVDPNRLKGAAAVVRESIKIDEKTGAATWKAKRDGYDEEIEVEAGLKEWAGTDEGKSYLAATGSPGGTGARTPTPGGAAGARPAATGTKQQQAEAKQARVQEAKTNLMTAVLGEISNGSIPIDGAG